MTPCGQTTARGRSSIATGFALLGAGYPPRIAPADHPLYDRLFDALRAHGHRPGLHLVADAHGTVRRAWLDAAGFGALGDSIEHAAQLYVRTGSARAADPTLRDDLQRLATGAGSPG